MIHEFTDILVDLHRPGDDEFVDRVRLVTSKGMGGIFLTTIWDNQVLKGGGAVYSVESMKALRDAIDSALKETGE